MKTEHKMIVGVMLIAVVMVVGFSLLAGKKEAKEQKRVSSPLMGEKMEDEGAGHVGRKDTHPLYKTNPPTSGPHWTDVAGGGIKDGPVADELVLHSMEHGAAVVWYREGLEQAEVDKIKQAFNNSLGKKIMLARKDLDVPVALTSWGYLMKLQTVDEATIKEFIETNNDRAPEKAPI